MGNKDFEITKEVGKYKNIGRFLENHDARTKEYKLVENKLKEIKRKFGASSKEVNEFFLSKF